MKKMQELIARLVRDDGTLCLDKLQTRALLRLDPAHSTNLMRETTQIMSPIFRDVKR